MEKRKLISKENKEKIVEQYLAGLGSDTIAKQFDIHPNTVLKILKKKGIQRRRIGRKKILIEDEKEIIKLYEEGKSAPEIAEKYDVAHTLILRYLKKNGIERRSAEECHRIYEINEDFFDVIDTQEKAYVLGFLYADGYNSIKGNAIRIDLATPDRDILEKIAKLIWPKDPLSHVKDKIRNKKVRKNAEEKAYYSSYLLIHSKHMCKKLEELGCVRAKSLILKFPEWLIDPELQRHFIRGYYDGDGGVHIPTIKGRGATARIISTFEFCSAMKDIISKNNIDANFGEPYHHLNVEGKNVYSVYMSGSRQVAKFLDWLYKDCSICLDRKYKLYLELLEKNKETDRLAALGTRGYSKKYLQK